MAHVQPETVAWHEKLMTAGRTQTLSENEVREWWAVVHQVLKSFGLYIKCNKRIIYIIKYKDHFTASVKFAAERQWTLYHIVAEVKLLTCTSEKWSQIPALVYQWHINKMSAANERLFCWHENKSGLSQCDSLMRQWVPTPAFSASDSRMFTRFSVRGTAAARVDSSRVGWPRS